MNHPGLIAVLACAGFLVLAVRLGLADMRARLGGLPRPVEPRLALIVLAGLAAVAAMLAERATGDSRWSGGAVMMGLAILHVLTAGPGPGGAARARRIDFSARDFFNTLIGTLTLVLMGLTLVLF